MDEIDATKFKAENQTESQMSRIRTPLSDSRNAASSQPRTSSRNNYVVEDDNSDYCSIDSSDEDDGDSAESDDNTSASDGYDNYNSSNSSESVSRVNSNVTGSIRSISSLGSGNNEYRKGRNHRGDLTTIDERSEDDDGSSEEGSSSGSSSGSSQSSSDSDSDSDSDSEGSSEVSIHPEDICPVFHEF